MTTNLGYFLNPFRGDTGSGGTIGLVPAPAAGDATKFLRGDATWATPSDTFGITQLTGDVTAGPGSGSQVATIAANAVTTSKINNNAVTLAKIVALSALSLLANPTGSSGNVSQVTLGPNLAFSGTTLDTIQNLRTTDSPTFAGLTLTSFSGLVTATAGVLSATLFPSATGYSALTNVSSTTPTDSNNLGYYIKNNANVDNVWETIGFVTRNGNIGGLIGAQITSQASNTVDIVLFGRNNSTGTTEGLRLIGATNLVSLAHPLPETSGGTGQNTLTTGDLIQASASNTFGKLSAVATGNALISGGVTTVSSWGKIGLTTHVSGLLPLANGGFNANLTASNGGIFYSTASAGAILVGTATASQMLQSGANAAPTWSTSTYPNITVQNQILYASSPNVVSGLSTANNGVLVTSSGGVPLISSTIPNATQDNITRLGTIANVGAAIGAAFGGTGNASYTIGDFLQASASTTLSPLAAVATGNALISGGVGTVSSWGKIGLTTHVSGILPYANGGTNASTAWGAGSVLFAGASSFSQDNTNLTWDNTNKIFNIGGTNPFTAMPRMYLTKSAPSNGILAHFSDSSGTGSAGISFGRTGTSAYGIVNDGSNQLSFYSNRYPDSAGTLDMRIAAGNITLGSTSSSQLTLNNVTSNTASNTVGGVSLPALALTMATITLNGVTGKIAIFAP